jgi:uncharacterized damage-inducible protein DinB
MPYTAQEYVQRFMMHRAALIDLLEKIPEDQGHFKSWEGGMSFITLTDHISSASLNLTNMAIGQERVKLEPSVTLSAALTRLKETTTQLQTMLGQLTSDQLAQKTSAFRGMEMSVYALIDFAREHEIHHKGQIWTMARMIGVEPPLLVKM